MMIVPSLIISSEEGVRNSFSAQNIVGELMSGAAPLRIKNTSSSAPRKLHLVVSQVFSMPPDKQTEATNNHGAALRHGAFPLVEQSKSSLVAYGAQTVPSAIIEIKPLNVGSLDLSVANNEVKSESGSLPFRKGQGRVNASKNRKYSAKNNSSVSGRWTAAEHEAFLQGLKVYGREWKKVANCIPTRTSAQIRSHAQKYFAKVTKEQQQLLASTESRYSTFPTGIPFKTNEPFLGNDQSISQTYTNTMKSILESPSEVETRVCKTLASLRERYKQLEDRLQQIQSPAPINAPGPATAALELEQKSLRKAALARYETKKLERKKHEKLPATTAAESSDPVCTHVSLATMPSYGGFDSSDVIALSMLGGNLGRER